MMMPVIKRTGSKKWSEKLSSIWRSPDNKNIPHEKDKDEMDPPEKKSNVYQSCWDSISDPEERRRAILAKHGFKPREPKKEKEDDDLVNQLKICTLLQGCSLIL